MKLAIVGASGRMGLTLIRLAQVRGWRLVGAVASPSCPHLGRDAGAVAGIGELGVELSSDMGSALLGAEVVIDFSTPDALRRLAPLAARAGVALMSGTTRLDEACTRALESAARSIPVLSTPNTSIGVHVLAYLATQAVRLLGADFDVEIVETHHRAKVDSPSGTAERLAEAVQQARASLEPVRERVGLVGPRGPHELGIVALRGGDVIGDHTVHLLGPGERLELTHRATDRELFARGALRAASLLTSRPPGTYAMADILAPRD